MIVNKTIGVVGVRGVGKTVLLEKIAVDLSGRVKVIHVGEELKKYSLNVEGKVFFEQEVKIRDEIRSKFGVGLAEQIRNNYGLQLLDMHLTDIREGKNKIIQPKDVLNQIDYFLMIDAADETIMARRKKDELRGRIIDKEILRQEREILIEGLKKVCEKQQKKYYIIQNNDSMEDLTEKFLTEINFCEHLSEWRKVKERLE